MLLSEVCNNRENINISQNNSNYIVEHTSYVSLKCKPVYEIPLNIFKLNNIVWLPQSKTDMLYITHAQYNNK